MHKIYSAFKLIGDVTSQTAVNWTFPSGKCKCNTDVMAMAYVTIYHMFRQIAFQVPNSGKVCYRKHIEWSLSRIVETKRLGTKIH